MDAKDELLMRCITIKMSSLAAILCLLSILAGSGAIAAATESYICDLPGGAAPITFIRLPKTADANIYAGMGQVEAAPQDYGGYELPATYLAKMELTLGQLKSLLPANEWKKYQDELLAVTGTDSDPKLGPFREAIRAGSDEYPAVMVGIKNAIDVCRALQEVTPRRSDGDDPESSETNASVYTSVSFRLPSAIEWRYAAGGRESLEGVAVSDSFVAWPEFDAELMGQWKDLCETIPQVRANVAPSPDQFCAVAEKLLENGNKDGYELLGLILQRTLGVEKHVFHLDEQGLMPVFQDSPSPWGLHRLYGNASELALTGSTPEAVEELWQSLNTANADAITTDEQHAILILGGQYLNTIPQKGKEVWKKWSLLHGQTDSGEPYKTGALYEVTPTADEDPPIVNLKPGIRLCIREVLAPDWFVHFRKTLRVTDDEVDAEKPLLDAASAVCLSSELKEVEAVTAAYKPALAYLWTNESEKESLQGSETRVSLGLATVGLSFANAAKSPDAKADDQVQADADAIARLFGGGEGSSGGASGGSKNKPLTDSDFFEILENIPDIVEDNET